MSSIFVPSPLEQAFWIGLMWAAALLLCAGVAFLISSLSADAMSLSITGHSAGTGIQNLSFAGDLLNVSIAQNGSSWNLTLGGMA